MPFVVTDAILGSDVLKQVSNSSHRSGAVTRASRNSGAATIADMYGVRFEEVTTLTTGDVEGISGFNSGNFFSEGLSVLPGTVTVPYKNRANGGLFQGATSHSQLTGSNALVICTGIEASQDSEVGATATLEVHWLSSDGTTAATTGSAGNSLASEAHNLEFALGTASLNSTALDSLTGVRINPGLSVVKQSAKGGNYPIEASIQAADPTIDLTLHDIDEVATVLDQFSAGLLTVFLRARKDGGTYETDATLAHLKFTFAAGISFAETIEAPETGNGSVTVRVAGKALAVTVDQAIT